MCFSYLYPKKANACAWRIPRWLRHLHVTGKFWDTNNLIISDVVFVCLACSTTLPTLSNAIVVSGNTGGPYFDGHMINYMCSSNFATTDGAISCTCDVTTDPDNPDWSCSPVFTTPICRRS